MRIEPPVSEPSAAQAAPVATETPPPEVEPPGMRGVGSSRAVAGLAGVPWCGLRPTPEKANSDMLVRPMKAAPARRSRATAGRVVRRGGCVGERGRGGAGRLALDVEQVLDRDRETGERPGFAAGGDRPVGGGGGGAGAGEIGGEEGAGAGRGSGGGDRLLDPGGGADRGAP